MNFDFNPKPIKIMLDTNIPNKPSIPLTRSILYLKNISINSVLGEYPLFVESFKYPRDYLYRTSYENRIKFFFSKSFFNKKMNEFNPQEAINYEKEQFEKNQKYENKKQGGAVQNQTESNVDNEEDKIKKQKEEQEKKYEINAVNELIEYNVITMLTALFPISYPVINNIRTSFNMKILKKSDIDFKISDLIPRPIMKLFKKRLLLMHCQLLLLLLLILLLLVLEVQLHLKLQSLKMVTEMLL
jgi:hypothetical protein